MKRRQIQKKLPFLGKVNTDGNDAYNICVFFGDSILTSCNLQPAKASKHRITTGLYQDCR